jgi:hypothetical protein
VNPVANYDNIALATFTLWQISTTELWVNTMYSAIAAVGVEQQPRPAHNPALALFFITFIVFGGFFVLQLFVSVTIDKVGRRCCVPRMQALQGLHSGQLHIPVTQPA